MKILSCPNEEFQNQFTAFSNEINELTTLALRNRVPIPMSRDISGLNDIILKCKRDRIKNLDPQVFDNVGQGSPRNVPNRIEDLNASRGEVIDNVGQRSPRSSAYGIDDVNASWGEVIDIVGQQYPRSGVFGIDNMNASRGEIIDNDGQQSPRSY